MERKVAGLDIHKDKIFCAVYDGKRHRKVKEFSTFASDIREMGRYLREEGVKEVAMESTGIYWVPVWNVLEDIGFSLILVNPLAVKQLAGRKHP